MSGAIQHDQSENLLQLASCGDAQSLGALLNLHRDRLKRTISLRLDDRLKGRIDASDVIQEAQLEAATRFEEYCRKPEVPFFVWLRFLACQRLTAMHRHHLGAQQRSVAREVSLMHGALPEASSAALAAQLLGHFTRPSEAVARIEMKLKLQQALTLLEPLDREVLALRHFEQLTAAESAHVMGTTEEAAKKRHLRALKKLKDAFETHVGQAEDIL